MDAGGTEDILVPNKLNIKNINNILNEAIDMSYKYLDMYEFKDWTFEGGYIDRMNSFVLTEKDLNMIFEIAVAEYTDNLICHLNARNNDEKRDEFNFKLKVPRWVKKRVEGYK